MSVGLLRHWDGIAARKDIFEERFENGGWGGTGRSGQPRDWAILILGWIDGWMDGR